MSAAARSLFVFGLYAVLAGLGLILVPATVLGLLGFPPTADGWVRVVGVLAVCVGAYHVVAARNELQPYLRASVPVRIGFAAGLAALVGTGRMPRALLLLAAVDLLGALWTAFALRQPSRAGAAASAA
ncbi:MAG TPA: hypothetical protein VHM30_06925 [Gemmatimonadaceae bacterium]|nr:hypothetical protein [Gemmatimonadaceae bacterium]